MFEGIWGGSSRKGNLILRRNLCWKHSILKLVSFVLNFIDLLYYLSYGSLSPFCPLSTHRKPFFYFSTDCFHKWPSKTFIFFSFSTILHLILLQPKLCFYQSIIQTCKYWYLWYPKCRQLSPISIFYKRKLDVCVNYKFDHLTLMSLNWMAFRWFSCIRLNPCLPNWSCS